MMPTITNTSSSLDFLRPITSPAPAATGQTDAPTDPATPPVADPNQGTQIQAAAQNNAAEQKRTAEQDKRDAEQAAEKLQKLLQVKTTSLSFSVDQDSGRYVVKITDSDTHEVLRQIPSKEALELAKAIDHLLGVFVDNRA